MADFNEHLTQANKNFSILGKINLSIQESWDWQVTISFYTALHLANAHIAKKINEHYRTHGKVENALNPYINLNPSAFEESAYLSYKALQNLSRRSRYLCSDKESDDKKAYLTYDKHFSKAIKHLDIISGFFSKTYDYKFNQIDISCEPLNNSSGIIYRCKS